MEIKTSEEIWKKVMDGVKVILDLAKKGMVDESFGRKHDKFAFKKWVEVNSLIKHIENSRSPDGDYPDADCIISDLKSLSTFSKKEKGT